MKKIMMFLNSLVIAGACMFFLSSFSNEKVESNPSLPQIIKAIDIDDHFHFAGEKVPVDNFDVAERLDRELTVNAYWQSSTMLNIKAASRYFPVIESILRENGIPDDFKYLAVAESALRNAKSSAGARGFWQFLKPAAREMGLEVNTDIDERYNLELSTRAACKYLKKNFNRFGNWTMAAAAYNAGPTRISKEKEKQKESSYYNLNLNEETSRYIFRIIALKEIMSNPEAFGFYPEPKDLYQPLTNYTIMQVDYQIDNLADFAHKYGITYRMLKVYNPWLRTDRLPNKSKKLYYIKIPKNY